jgi:hypothetical protein
MTTLFELKQQVTANPSTWSLYLMNFVDDFRRQKDVRMLREPFIRDNDQIDALLASTAEYLCDEQGIQPPTWLNDVPASRKPWFVAGIESLKAIALAESPLRFRIRKVFVLENFLSRV